MGFQDLSNMRFGRLICIKPVARYEKSRAIIWQCKCDCGNVIEVVSNSLTSGNTRSCGCLQKETAAKTCRKRTIHGFGAKKMTNSGLYKSWAHMKERCLSPNCPDFKNYGGRGITICDKWLTFKGFWDDMGPTYAEGATIDRIDNNGNYEPGNCRWASRSVQNNNKRNNRMIEYQGIEKTMAEWARCLGINYSTLANRLYCGWSIDRSINTPAHRPRKKPVYVAE